jgi:hypothetical protein
MRVKQKYRNTLSRYLNWITSDFLRPKFELDESGISAAEAMLQWETYGQKLPLSSSEPEQLALYVQGKTSRDFYIDNWREDVKQGQAVPEEFLYSLGLDEQEFKSVFSREPDPFALFLLGMRHEFLRFTEGRVGNSPLIEFLRVALSYERKEETGT